MLVIKNTGQLEGCIDNGTNHCSTCVWNKPTMIESYGECPKRKKYALMGFFLSSYLRTCEKCFEIYGCRIVGTNFSIERICSGCPEYFNCKMVDNSDPKTDGHCLHCSNKGDYDDED
jgi:hypothetical protein